MTPLNDVVDCAYELHVTRNTTRRPGTILLIIISLLKLGPVRRYMSAAIKTGARGGVKINLWIESMRILYCCQLLAE